MTATVTINTVVNGTTRSITCTVNSGADIPSDIFLYENDNGQPGTFFAVCALSDYQRFQTYTGTTIPVFGNKYVKQTFGQKDLDVNVDFSTVAPTFVSNCQAFRNDYLNFTAPSSQTYPL
jgi:hypothetical protein